VYRIASTDEAQGKYKLITELGRGGTANVYLAVARGVGGFNKLVVLKTLKDDLAGDPDFHGLFLNEARLAARLSHPNVVQTYEVAVEHGLPIIVMEYLDGQPLANILSRTHGALPIAEHVRILIEALAGLHYAHELVDFDGTPLGVVHRDVTPQNLFVTFDGQIKILDFGIAKLANSLVQTQTGVVKGKTRYMPPEQLSGEPIDRRADIFAMGVMLWEAAAGQTLWRGLPDATITNRVLNGDIPRPSTVNPEAPKALESICMKALAVDRSDRYATASELEADLEEVIGVLGPPVSTRRIGKAIAAVFMDVRSKTKQLVDAELGKLGIPALGPADGANAPSTPPPDPGAAEAQPLATDMTFARADLGIARSWPGVPELGEVPGAVVDFRPLGWAAVSVAAFAVGVWLWNSASTRAELAARQLDGGAVVASAPPANSTASTSAAERVLPSKPRVQIRVATQPSDAVLYLDERPVEQNPYSQSVAVDGEPHTLRAEAEGYQSRSLAVVFERDAEILLALERVKPAPRRTRSLPSSSAAQVAGASAALPPPPPPSCESPYYIDERGIKKFRPECM